MNPRVEPIMSISRIHDKRHKTNESKVVEMQKYSEDYNKLLKLDVHYCGSDTYSFTPRFDKKDQSLTLGHMIVSGSDDAMRKFCMRMGFKDVESQPDSFRAMKYCDMVLGMKAGIVSQLWIWRKNWNPSSGKIYLDRELTWNINIGAIQKRKIL